MTSTAALTLDAGHIEWVLVGDQLSRRLRREGVPGERRGDYWRRVEEVGRSSRSVVETGIRGDACGVPAETERRQGGFP